jgi:DNA-binding NarL/FixJ family response regulator
MIRVAIADDQALVRAGLRMICESDPELTVVGEAADGRAAVELVRSATPDVLLLDIRMPVMDGVEACGLVTSMTDRTRVLMLTTFDLDEYVFAAVRNGASGFLLKDTAAEQLLAAIRVIAAGDALMSPSVTRRLIEEFARSGTPPESSASDVVESLTEREHEVLVLMARGLANAEIAAQLYLGETTVKTHVGRVLMKLGVRDRVQAVVFAYEHALVVPGRP